MADDVVLDKVASLERRMARVREEHAGADENLFGSQTRQDAIVLNLQRACDISRLGDFLDFGRAALKLAA